MLVFAAFAILLILALSRSDTRRALLSRDAGDWWLDGSGLLLQGFAVPALATALGAWLLPRWWPAGRGIFAPPSWIAFAAAFVGVDYLYYWNHRWLHARAAWPLHAAHHGGSRLDVLSTARNSAWTPFAIVYLWAHAAALFLLADPAPYSLGMAATAALDLYRHTGAGAGGADGILGNLFVTASQHAAHHARGVRFGNFGANLNLWDRLHGTFIGPAPADAAVGLPSARTAARQFLLPFPSEAP